MTRAQMKHNGLPIDQRVYDDPWAEALRGESLRRQTTTDSEAFLYDDRLGGDRPLIPEALQGLSVFADGLLDLDAYPNDVVETFDEATKITTVTRTGELGSTLTRAHEIIPGGEGPINRYTYTFGFSKGYVFTWNDDPDDPLFRTPWRDDVRGIHDIQQVIESSFWQREQAPQPKLHQRLIGRIAARFNVSKDRQALPR